LARKRMIDPSFWRDEKIGECSYIERLLFIGLWTFSEDSGVGRANPKLIKADVFPYDTLRDSDIEKSLAKLASLGLILLYEIDGQRYYFIINFKKHQTINKPTPSTLPLPLPEHYGSTTVALPPEEKRKEDKINIGDFFETLWSMYPRKEGKGSISKTQKEKLLKIGIDEMTRAISRYKAKISSENTERKFIKQGSTFFNSGYVDYLDANYVSPEAEEHAAPRKAHIEIIDGEEVTVFE
jgi:hypothetical protein